MSCSRAPRHKHARFNAMNTQRERRLKSTGWIFIHPSWHFSFPRGKMIFLALLLTERFRNQETRKDSQLWQKVYLPPHQFSESLCSGDAQPGNSIPRNSHISNIQYTTSIDARITRNTWPGLWTQVTTWSRFVLQTISSTTWNRTQQKRMEYTWLWIALKYKFTTIPWAINSLSTISQELKGRSNSWNFGSHKK